MKEIRRIDIFTRKLVNQRLAGQYHSVFKGRGMNFDEVRPYQPGDEIRSIDWNVTARTGDVYVKQFVEERELTIYIMIDLSASMDFGLKTMRKQHLAARIAALLTFSAVKNNDRVSLITFSDRVMKFIPPKKGKKHVLRIIREILGARAEGKTDIPLALEFLGRIAKRRGIVMLISDFFEKDERANLLERSLCVAARRHDLIPVVIADPFEERLPQAGLFALEDPETGGIFHMDTSVAAGGFFEESGRIRARRETLFKKHRVDFINLRTDGEYIKALMNYFVLRGKRF